mgnify:CR=1 FL=1
MEPLLNDRTVAEEALIDTPQGRGYTLDWLTGGHEMREEPIDVLAPGRFR